MFIISAPIIFTNQQLHLGSGIPDSITTKTAPAMQSSDFNLIIPAKEEYLGFKYLFAGHREIDRSNIKELKNAGCFSLYSWTIQRESDKLILKILIAISLNPDVVGMVSSLGVSNLSHNPDEKKTSFSGKLIGKYVWSYPKTLFIEDNWVLMKIDLRPQNTRNADNKISFGTITEADKLWAEELGQKILDRATVLGLTSRRPTSAPLWAKEQVAKRRAERKQ